MRSRPEGNRRWPRRWSMNTSVSTRTSAIARSPRGALGDLEVRKRPERRVEGRVDRGGFVDQILVDGLADQCREALPFPSAPGVKLLALVAREVDLGPDAAHTAQYTALWSRLGGLLRERS